ncbi:MAG: hypothetical protein NC098_07785, partial [Lachnoclostridium sp.]|nr:hypothetical protein [Lachnoclostridium sp.]
MTAGQSFPVVSSGESETSFLKSVTPPTPQTAALSRYGEHPVDLSNGLVDISIPIYDIEVGSFKLPISLSYHASGVRLSDISTSVGLGWVLNAGGAISRSINGVPDRIIPFGANQQNERELFYRYREISGIKSLIDNGNLEKIQEISTANDRFGHYSLESDRYTYNFAGHSGVMRFDHVKDDFVPLNFEHLTIYTSGDVDDSQFTVIDSRGLEFHFNQHERTGFDEEGFPPITAWYLSEISTPWGKIEFHYISAPRYRAANYHTSADIGKAWYTDGYDESGGPWDQSTVVAGGGTDYIRSYTYFNELLIAEIHWDGNKVKFTYDFDREYTAGDGETVRLPRLTAINIINSNGKNIRKAVLNHQNWGDSASNYRTLLSSVYIDSEGEYKFSYNDTSTPLPDYSQAKNRCDYWGYYNGNISRSSVAREAYKNSLDKWTSRFGKPAIVNPESYYADRSCNPVLMQKGVLNRIEYPTGGNTQFLYETHRNNDSELYGGLRIKEIITNPDAGGETIRKRYEYDGICHTVHPRDLMTYSRHVSYPSVKPGVSYIEEHYIIDDSYVGFSTCGLGCPLKYSLVKVIDSDGTVITNVYTRGQLADNYLSFNVDDIWSTDGSIVHPSIRYSGNSYDEGNTPMLPSAIIVSDNSGKMLSEQTFIYSGFKIREFNAGVRLFKSNNFSDPQGRTNASEFLRTPYLYYRPIKCVAKTFAEVEKRVTDHTTGFSTYQKIDYDSIAWHTLQPRRVSEILSDGRTAVTEYTYIADCKDDLSRELADKYLMTDALRLITTRIDGEKTISSKTDYAVFSGPYGKWALPSASFTSFGEEPFIERERITAFNSHGRPLAIITEETDTTFLDWGEDGINLHKLISSGSLTTTFTSEPLVGITSITDQRGYRIDYDYLYDGRLSKISDHRGIISQYVYAIKSRDGSDANSITSLKSLDGSGLRGQTAISYHDGLGRPTLSADNSVSPAGRYLNTLQIYDNQGRVCLTTSPAIGGISPSDLSFEDIKGLLASTYPDSVGWSIMRYDDLGRQIETTLPGDDWTAKQKAVTKEYISNSANDVKLYTAPLSSTSLVKNGYYAPGTLCGERTIDADGRILTVFTDRSGRKVLERRDRNNDTYFIYNDYGQLRFVLTPGYQESGYRDKFAYEYRYDERGNVVKTILPGCDASRSWYNRANRQTFFQDALLQASDRHRFMLYDNAGRLCVQGLASSSDRSLKVNRVALTESPNSLGGYAMEDPSRLSVSQVEVVNYYDDYSFLSLYGRSLPADVANAPPATGLLTGSRTRLSDGSEMLEVLFYDAVGNVTKTHSFSLFGHSSVSETEYTFTGQPLSTSYQQGDISLKVENTYSQVNGALTRSVAKLDSEELLLADNSYDDLGRVTSRGFGSRGLKMDFRYNIHGWPTQLACLNPSVNFVQNLHYASGVGIPQYSGNISSMDWKIGRNEKLLRGYRYSYDELNRLTEAAYGDGEDLDGHAHRYSERVLSYSANGSIRRFQRHGLKNDGIYGKIDNLHLDYDGNQLTSVTEDALPVTRYSSANFEPYEGGGHCYGYNGVGALTRDLNRGIENI